MARKQVKILIEGRLQRTLWLEDDEFVDVEYGGAKARLRGGDTANFYDPDRNAFSDMRLPHEAIGNTLRTVGESIRSLKPW